MELRPLKECVNRRAFFSIGLALLVGFGAGCERSTPVTDVEAAQEKNYQRAKKLSEEHDFQSAAEFYKKALIVNPEFADAHLELGLLCDNNLGDPIAAIYHYRCYLELRPNSEKKQLVTDFIERARLSLAARLPQSAVVDPAELTRLQNDKAALLQENAQLRTQVAELEKASAAAVATSETAGPRPVPSVTTPAAPVADTSLTTPAQSAESSTRRMHMVQRGDTLYALALKYYGTRSAWDRIYQANRSELASRDQLKVGQQLIIP